MRVSLILTVLNEGSGMAELLDALLAQSRMPDEIVIVDGGSRDGTQDILNRYSQNHPLIKVFVEPGVNIARGRNLAILRATGDVLAVTDGGCRPERDWLRELVKPLEFDPELGAVAGRFVPVFDTRFEYYCGRISVPDLAKEAEQGSFFGRSSAFRRSLWEEVGGYPEWLYTAEDTLFAISSKRRGYRVVFAPNSVLTWRPRPNFGKLFKMYYLYGRGNGRINQGDVRGSIYWLRNYLALAVSLVAGLIWPWLWLISLAAGWHLWQNVVRPNLGRYQHEPNESSERYFYIPLLVLIRNFATSLGYIRGWLEYRKGGVFKDKLEDYLYSNSLRRPDGIGPRGGTP